MIAEPDGLMQPASPASAFEWDELLTEALDESIAVSVPALAELANRFGGMTLIDSACRDDASRPLVLKASDLLAHLRRTDSAPRRAERGHPLHTSQNLTFGSAEDVDGYGPGMR